ncbi:MAG TPA: DUF309 domain-containing protein [Candidatus Polarisedimenticolia bacterium]|nr:DUF309 domain-containing protein [Candidatus Polarisedimenticolia bacterium]
MSRLTTDFADRLEEGVDLFNRGAFFQAHEVWEVIWRKNPGEPAYFLHGLIQIAAGFVKLLRGEPKGAAALLLKGARKLERFSPGRYGLAIDGLLESAASWNRTAGEMAAAGRTDFDRSALPRLPDVSSAAADPVDRRRT